MTSNPPFTRSVFKPPRPISNNRSVTTASSNPAPSTSTENPMATDTRKAAVPWRLSSSSMSSDGVDVGDDKLAGSGGNDAESSEEETAALGARKEPPIAPRLLSRLLHDHFKHDDTRMTKEAMAVLQKYFEVFMLEAVHRANFEGLERGKGSSRRSSGVLFLEVEDLERLMPQLLLDF